MIFFLIFYYIRSLKIGYDVDIPRFQISFDVDIFGFGKGFDVDILTLKTFGRLFGGKSPIWATKISKDLVTLCECENKNKSQKLVKSFNLKSNLTKNRRFKKAELTVKGFLS